MHQNSNTNITIGLLIIISLCVYIIYPYRNILIKKMFDVFFGGKEGFSFFGGKEGFQYLGYPPFAGPGYFFNFPTREYPPLTFGGYDLRGPPGCPYFGRCGEAIRRGDVTTPDKRFFYDYWWPVPQFRYDKFYGANGKIHDA